MASLELGFIGIGRMGRPMSERLLEAGYRLTVSDTNPAAVGDLVARGATAAASPAEVAARVETVLLSLPTPEVVRSVIFGEKGLLAGSRLRAVVDLSTTGPRVAAEIAEGLAQQGVKAVDSPVSGGVAGAQKGTLAVMTSCERALFDALEPMLQQLGRPFYVGAKPGMGQMMKLLNNLVSVTALAISSEALVLGTKAGLDPEVIVEVVNAGSGRNNAMVDKIPKYVLPRSFDFGFAVSLSAKDIRLCLEESDVLGVPMVVGSAVRQLLAITKANFGPDADLTTIIKSVEEWAEVEVAGAGVRPRNHSFSSS